MSTRAAAVGHPRAVATVPRPRVPGWVWRTAGPLLAITLWALAAALVDSIAILPGPADVLRNVAENATGSPALAYLGLEVTSYAGNLLYTGRIVLGAVLVGSLLGLAAGTASARVQWVRDVTEPVTLVFGVVPVLVAAPFFLVWFGSGPLSKFLLVTFFTAVTVSVVAQAAVLALPARYEEYAATLGVGPLARLRSVVSPATLAMDLTGIRAALGQAWGLEAVAELLGSPAGVGRVVAVRAGTGDVTSVLALLLALGVLALVCDAALLLATRLLSPWHTSGATS